MPSNRPRSGIAQTRSGPQNDWIFGSPSDEVADNWFRAAAWPWRQAAELFDEHDNSLLMSLGVSGGPGEKQADLENRSRSDVASNVARNWSRSDQREMMA